MLGQVLWWIGQAQQNHYSTTMKTPTTSSPRHIVSLYNELCIKPMKPRMTTSTISLPTCISPKQGTRTILMPSFPLKWMRFMQWLSLTSLHLHTHQDEDTQETKLLTPLLMQVFYDLILIFDMNVKIIKILKIHSHGNGLLDCFLEREWRHHEEQLALEPDKERRRQHQEVKEDDSLCQEQQRHEEQENEAQWVLREATRTLHECNRRVHGEEQTLHEERKELRQRACISLNIRMIMRGKTKFLLHFKNNTTTATTKITSYIAVS